MEQYRIMRTFMGDIFFIGELLAKADDRHATPGSANWMELALYRTITGEYVLGTTLRSYYPKNERVTGAVRFPSADKVADFLRAEGKVVSSLVDHLLEKAALLDGAFAGLAEGSPSDSAVAV
jgi:hypothetical protein